MPPEAGGRGRGGGGRGRGRGGAMGRGQRLPDGVSVRETPQERYPRTHTVKVPPSVPSTASPGRPAPEPKTEWERDRADWQQLHAEMYLKRLYEAQHDLAFVPCALRHNPYARFRNIDSDQENKARDEWLALSNGRRSQVSDKYRRAKDRASSVKKVDFCAWPWMGKSLFPKELRRARACLDDDYKAPEEYDYDENGVPPPCSDWFPGDSNHDDDDEEGWTDEEEKDKKQTRDKAQRNEPPEDELIRIYRRTVQLLDHDHSDDEPCDEKCNALTSSGSANEATAAIHSRVMQSIANIDDEDEEAEEEEDMDENFEEHDFDHDDDYNAQQYYEDEDDMNEGGADEQEDAF